MVSFREKFSIVGFEFSSTNILKKVIRKQQPNFKDSVVYMLRHFFRHWYTYDHGERPNHFYCFSLVADMIHNII